MKRYARVAWFVGTVLAAVGPAASADWPQFLGPDRDNKSADTGLLKTWPEGGPPRLWEATGIGEGWSTVAIAGDRIYTTGSVEGGCVITALDMDGKRVWTRKNGQAWSGSYPGTRSTPTIADGLLFHLSGIGNLVCLKADSGEPVWSANIRERFGGRNITWGLAESPLVFDDRVVCTPGGEEVSMVALDRKTGKVIWECKGAGDRAGYASPILVEYKGLKQIVTVMSQSVVGVRASDGKLLWKFPHKVYADENILAPIFHEGFLIVSGCVRKGTTCLQLDVSGDTCSVKVRWHNPTLDNKQGGLVLAGGRIYGFAEHLGRSTPWVCIDFTSGTDIFRSAPVESSYMFRSGCLTYADGMFYLYSDDGRLVLARATDKGFEVAGRLALKEPGKRPTWAFPVVCGGRLYVRYGDRLAAYSVQAPPKPRERPVQQAKPPSPNEAELLARIEAGDLPQGYDPARHQEYVDRRIAALSPQQRAEIGRLWREKQRLDPDMSNRGKSFVKIMEYVAAEPGGKPPKRPANVVILLADDLGWQDIGCYGGPAKTPALDALAAQGVRFTDFHAGASVCSPSRATLLTGRQHMRAGIYHVLQDTTHNAHLLEREVTIAEVLKQAGYGTAHFGKWHLGLTSSNRKKPSPAEHGFDYWFGLANGADPSQKDPVNFIRNGKRVGPLKGYSCQIVVDDAIQWLSEQRRADQPFFLNVWFNEPHSVLAAPDEIVSRYGGLKDPAALYSGAIDNTDRAIARLVAKLKDMGELENTLIIYSSDNGSYREDRNGGLRGDKGSNFEGGIRSPGIFYWPRGIAGGRVEYEPAGAVDLLPTICGLLGVDKPKGVHLDGSDLSPLLTGRGKFHREQPLFWHLPTSYPSAALRDGRYMLAGYRDYELPQDREAMATLFNQIAKLVRKEDGKPSDAELRARIFNREFDQPEARRLSIQYVRLNEFQESWIPLIRSGGFRRFELYDLASDPQQKTDVSARHPDVVARLRKQLLEINTSVMADAPLWSGKQ